MAEQRLIDSNADVYPYVTTWTCNCSEYGVQNVMAVDDISTLPEIDPETLPIVQQLRAELERVTAERDAAVSDLKTICDCDYCEGGCVNTEEECCMFCEVEGLPGRLAAEDPQQGHSGGC